MRRVICERIQREICIGENILFLRGSRYSDSTCIEAYENYLRVILIRSGDSVNNHNEVGLLPKRVEPRRRNYARPFRIAKKASRKRRAFLCIYLDFY